MNEIFLNLDLLFWRELAGLIKKVCDTLAEIIVLLWLHLYIYIYEYLLNIWRWLEHILTLTISVLKFLTLIFAQEMFIAILIFVIVLGTRVFYIRKSKEKQAEKMLFNSSQLKENKKIKPSTEQEGDLKEVDDFPNSFSPNESKRRDLPEIAKRILYKNQSKCSGLSNHLRENMKGSFQASVVVSIEGRWGDGKTTFLNALIEYIDKEIKKQHTLEINFRQNNVINFNPWSMPIKTETDLTLRLLEEIRLKATNKENLDSTDSEELKTYFEGYENIFLDMATFVGGYYNIDVKPILSKIFPHLEKKFTLGEIHSLISYKLLKLNSPIIVVIDDVDRLGGEEIYLLTKIIRAGVSFPNLIFLLCLDRGRVGERLSKYGGLDYLEKIIDFSYSVENYDSPAEPLEGLLELNPHVTGNNMWDEFSILWLDTLSRREKINTYNELVARINRISESEDEGGHPLKKYKNSIDLKDLIHRLNMSERNGRNEILKYELIPILLGIILALKYPKETYQISKILSYESSTIIPYKEISQAIDSISGITDSNMRDSTRCSSCGDSYANKDKPETCSKCNHKTGRKSTEEKRVDYLIRLICSTDKKYEEPREKFFRMLTPELTYRRKYELLSNKAIRDIASIATSEYTPKTYEVSAEQSEILGGLLLGEKEIRLRIHVRNNLLDVLNDIKVTTKDIEKAVYKLLPSMSIYATRSSPSGTKLLTALANALESLERHISETLFPKYKPLSDSEPEEKEKIKKHEEEISSRYKKLVEEAFQINKSDSEPEKIYWILRLMWWKIIRYSYVDARKETTKSPVWKETRETLIKGSLSFERKDFLGKEDREFSGEMLASAFLTDTDTLIETLLDNKSNDTVKMNLQEIYERFCPPDEISISNRQELEGELLEILIPFFNQIISFYSSSDGEQINLAIESIYSQVRQGKEVEQYRKLAIQAFINAYIEKPKNANKSYISFYEELSSKMSVNTEMIEIVKELIRYDNKFYTT